MRALKNCQRITLSLPNAVISKLYKNISKSKRSGYVAQVLEQSFLKEAKESRGTSFWEEFWKRNPPKELGKSAVELVREDRQSH